MDVPNAGYSKISTRIEIIFKSHNYLLHEVERNILRDYNIELSSLNVPILLRFREYYSSIQPFFNFGVVLGVNFKNSIHVVETIFVPPGNPVNEFNLDLFDDFELGAAVGVGLEYQIDYKRTAGIEIRYNITFGIQSPLTHEVADLQVLASFSF